VSAIVCPSSFRATTTTTAPYFIFIIIITIVIVIIIITIVIIIIVLLLIYYYYYFFIIIIIIIFQMVSCDLIAYYFVWVCLFIPFITEVITDKTNESCYCVSYYQFAVLGRVVRGGSWCIVLVIRIVICSFASALLR
jgi:hypothetical protein